MARGFDSKDVEGQIAAARERADRRVLQITPEQRELERKRDSFQLQRTRVLKQLETCAPGGYRRSLEEGLAFLEKHLAELG